MSLRNVCVYCGSRPGSRPAYVAAARELGLALAQRGLGLVYGGASIGVMGAVADAALQGGAPVIGVIPRALDAKEVAHRGLSQLHVVESMHERKALMAQHADAFVAMPGGIGTFEELFEVWTWLQLGYHAKPVAVLNVEGYWDGLLAFLDRGVAEGFISPDTRQLLGVADSVEGLLDLLANWQAPARAQWMGPGQT